MSGIIQKKKKLCERRYRESRGVDLSFFNQFRCCLFVGVRVVMIFFFGEVTDVSFTFASTMLSKIDRGGFKKNDISI